MNQTQLADSQQKVENMFHVLDQGSTYIAKQLEKSYLEALIDSGESLFQGEIVVEMTKEQQTELRSILDGYDEQALTREEKRRAFQLAILNGMKAYAVPGTGITPDTVSMLMAYIIQKMMKPTKVLDPAVGSGNLLTCVLNQFEHDMEAWGTEVDATLIRLAFVNANLQEHPIELFHQDGLKDIQIPPVDLVVSDLPVGKYPDEERARQFALHDAQQEPYTHHLFIEQSIMLCEEGGYMVFLIPNTLFNEPGAEALRHLITKNTYIQAILQLPESLFQEGSIYKSIFILQKKGQNIKKPTETLMASLPSMQDEKAFGRMLDRIEAWVEVNKHE